MRWMVLLEWRVFFAKRERDGMQEGQHIHCLPPQGQVMYVSMSCNVRVRNLRGEEKVRGRNGNE